MSLQTRIPRAAHPSEKSASLPPPVYERRKALVRLVWLVPLLAAIIAGLYARTFLRQRGPEITVALQNADGIKVGDTPVMHRGVVIGKVADLQLTPDHRQALVKVRLQKGQEDFAKEGAEFWIVRPELSATSVRALSTLFSGPYIDSQPGKSDGDRKDEFNALGAAPQNLGEGLNIRVHASRLEHLDEHSPVYYKGIQVGVVRNVRLGQAADVVEARVLIWRGYAPLVRSNSRFWGLSGFDVKGGILSGVQMKLESIKTLISGGIAFATPDKDTGPVVKPGRDFLLESDPKEEWLGWAPHIPIHPGDAEFQEQQQNASASAARAEAATHTTRK